LGAEAYQYVVDYQFNVKAALAKLLQEVFASGEYNGAERKPKSPEEALEMAGADGTRSILDILRIGSKPDHFVAAPLTPAEYQRYFGTDKPALESIQECDDLWDDIERGMARYVFTYENGRPTKIVFLGYSFD
jgi:hypothetical protein